MNALYSSLNLTQPFFGHPASRAEKTKWQKAVIFTSENPVPDPEIQCVQKCRSTLVESANFLLTNFRKNNTYRKNNEREVKMV